MPAFISKHRGVVVRVDVNSAKLGSVSPFAVRVRAIPDLGNANNADTRICITQVSISENTNHQIQHTFGKSIYVYVFGDRVGELKLSGVCFDAACGSGGESGITKLQRIYDERKLSQKVSPLVVTMGADSTRVALLTGMTMEMIDAETQLMQWSLRMATFKANT